MKEITNKMIALAAKGDQYAIEELYNLTYDSVYKATKAMMQDEDAVLDILQDSYVKAFQSLDQLDAPENFRAWLKRIATNKAKDYLKKKKPILFSEMAGEDGEEIDFRDECPQHLPEEVLDRRETTRLMDEILSSLSEDQRMAIGLHYYQDMSIKQIAQLMGCSENTVKSRLNYGRKKVEAKVRELEKKGTKLYSLAPLPFLLWLFSMYAKTAETPSATVLEGITAQCAAGGGISGGASSSASAGASSGAQAAAVSAKAAAGAGTKVLAAKIIAGVLAVAVAAGGTALAISVKNREKNEPAPPDVSADAQAPGEDALPNQADTPAAEATEETATVPSSEEIYRGILTEYRTVLQEDSTAFLAAYENYFNGDHLAIRYYHMYGDGEFCFAYYDIDGNGTQELLMGIGFGENASIIDLYGFDGQQVVQLVDEPTLGDRSRMTLLADGTLYFHGSGGADVALEAYWAVDGHSIQDAPASTAEPVTHIPWQILALE